MEEQTKFSLASLNLGLEFIHPYNLIHRDIKPENLLMDSRGYLRITDFGISSIYNKNKKTHMIQAEHLDIWPRSNNRE